MPTGLRGTRENPPAKSSCKEPPRTNNITDLTPGLPSRSHLCLKQTRVKDHINAILGKGTVSHSSTTTPALGSGHFCTVFSWEKQLSLIQPAFCARRAAFLFATRQAAGLKPRARDWHIWESRGRQAQAVLSSALREAQLWRDWGGWEGRYR